MAKVCSKCKKEKPFSEYNKSKYGKFGLESKCRECTALYYKKWYNNGGKEKGYEYLNNNPGIYKKNVSKYQSKMTPGVYRVFGSNGEYIGQSMKIERRCWNHKHWNTESPVDGFISYEILEIVEDKDLRLEREKYWINKLKPSLNTKSK